jgi:hypothetical protein
MTDKLRSVASLVITMENGENPSAAKFNAISNQVRSATNVLEKAIGDLWNQSGDSLTVSYPLQIPNLARSLGQMKYMNPCLYPVDEDFVYVDNVGAKYENQNEFYFQFKPKTLSSVSVNDSGGGALVTRVTNKSDVDGTGDYWVDSSNGKIISFNAISSSAEVQYTVDSTDWNIRDYTFPSVIPDPRQNDFTACRVSTSGGKYYLHLPPRLPLLLDFDNGAFDDWSLPDRYPSSSDLSDNYDTAVAAVGSKKLWQSPGVNALEDAFYRYPLPKEIKDNLSSLNVGDSLPFGFLYLWDRTSGTIIADAVFRKTSDDWVFEIESAYIDFSGKVSGSEVEQSYNGTNYSVIAVGSPVSRSFWTLTNAMMNHTHGNEGEFSSLMSHSNLLDLNPPTSDYSGHSSTYPTDVPAWAPSRWSNDDHISLLSRAGSQGTVGGRNRDVNDNAMLGDFVLASTAADSGNYLNILADSNRLYFGSVVAGPYLFFDQSNSAIMVQSQSDSEIPLWAKSTDNYSLIAEGKVATPTKSALRIVPQSSLPSGPNQVGDICVYNAKLYICSVAGTPGTWTIVGSQS